MPPPVPQPIDLPAAINGPPGGGVLAVAHFVGAPLVLASALTIAGIDLWVVILVIGALAMMLLFAFERTERDPADLGSAWARPPSQQL